jgi:hypothetical protein
VVVGLVFFVVSFVPPYRFWELGVGGEVEVVDGDVVEAVGLGDGAGVCGEGFEGDDGGLEVVGGLEAEGEVAEEARRSAEVEVGDEEGDGRHVGNYGGCGVAAVAV